MCVVLIVPVTGVIFVRVVAAPAPPARAAARCAPGCPSRRPGRCRSPTGRTTFSSTMRSPGSSTRACQLARTRDSLRLSADGLARERAASGRGARRRTFVRIVLVGGHRRLCPRGSRRQRQRRSGVSARPAPRRQGAATRPTPRRTCSSKRAPTGPLAVDGGAAAQTRFIDSPDVLRSRSITCWRDLAQRQHLVGRAVRRSPRAACRTPRRWPRPGTRCSCRRPSSCAWPWRRRRPCR